MKKTLNIISLVLGFYSIIFTILFIARFSISLDSVELLNILRYVLPAIVFNILIFYILKLNDIVERLEVQNNYLEKKINELTNKE